LTFAIIDVRIESKDVGNIVSRRSAWWPTMMLKLLAVMKQLAERRNVEGGGQVVM
jgi:hypothetical protein